MAKELGYDAKDIEWKQAPSAERENLIANGDVKFVVASYSINDERKQKVDFAGPYFLAHQDLLVRADDNSITKAIGPELQEALLGHRLHLGAEHQGPNSPPRPTSSRSAATRSA